MNDDPKVVLGLDGAEMALLVASTFTFLGWPFAKESARKRVTAAVRQRADEVNTAISEQARRSWKAAGVWEAPTGTWTKELIRQRAAVFTQLRLSRDQVRDAALSLRVAYEEFCDNWHEFCVATPGNVDWYDTTPRSLEELASKLEGALS